MQLNGTSVGNYIAQAALSLYQHYELTAPARAGIMAIQECHNKIELKTKLGAKYDTLSILGAAESSTLRGVRALEAAPVRKLCP